MRRNDVFMKACVFPGQGTQFLGMGKDLFAKYPLELDICDEVLGYSIRNLCLENCEGKLNQTQYTQPAIYVVNALSYLEYLSRSEKPSMVAGHSLGEFNALMAAGVFNFATGLKLVKKRGELMGQIKGGGMAAILGMSSQRIHEILEQHKLSNIYISNYNAPLQYVIGGRLEDIKTAKNIFQCAGVRIFSVLNVSGAFHTIYMEDVREKFSVEVKKNRFDSPQIPVISNVTAQPYSYCELEETIINQMICPVRWVETVTYMLEHGIKEVNQIGSGKILINLHNQISKEFKNASTSDSG